MALQPMVHDSLPVEVSTGITGVTAYKCGHVVTLSINIPTTTVESSGWHTFGAVPDELKPVRNLKFAGFNNSATGYNDSFTVAFHFTAAGNLNGYFFGNKLTMEPVATITYLTNN